MVGCIQHVAVIIFVKLKIFEIPKDIFMKDQKS